MEFRMEQKQIEKECVNDFRLQCFVSSHANSIEQEKNETKPKNRSKATTNRKRFYQMQIKLFFIWFFFLSDESSIFGGIDADTK